MAATFPLDTSQPWTYNGVTYRYDASADMWYAVSSEGSTQLAEDFEDLEERVDAIEGGSINLDEYYTKTEVDALIDGIDPDVVLSNYYTIAQVDSADQLLQDQIDNLTITKGTAATYTLTGVGITVGIRPGDFYIDNAIVSQLAFISLARDDDNGNNRPIGEEGDILEIHGPNNVSYRYTIEQISDGIAAVDYTAGNSPDDLLVPGTTYNIYIYPKNGNSASVEYVNSQLDKKLSLTGGDLSGTLNTNALVKSTRTSGYAYLVYDEENESNTAFIHSNGNIRGAAATFTSSLEVRGSSTFKDTFNVEGNVNCNGGWIKGNWGIDTNGKGVRWYSSDRNDHLADITFQTDKLETLIYDDYLWTLKVQNSGNTDSNTLISADYSSGLTLNEVNQININGNINSDGHFFTKGGSFRIDKTDETKQFQIYPNGGDGFGATIYTYNNGFFKVRIAEGDEQSPYKEFINCQVGDNIVGGVTHPVSSQINWLKTPTSNHHAANKQYVDDMGQIYYGNIVPAGSEVHDGDLWVDSGNMRLLMRASGAWVNPDREADTDAFRKYISPNGRKFGFSSGTGTVTGKLNYYDSGGLKLRLSNTDKDGVKWNDGGITEDVTMSNGPFFTIWEWVNDSNHKIIRQGRVSRIDYHSSDILCYLSSHRTNGGFSTSKNYWVTIGGII